MRNTEVDYLRGLDFSELFNFSKKQFTNEGKTVLKIIIRSVPEMKRSGSNIFSVPKSGAAEYGAPHG